TDIRAALASEGYAIDDAAYAEAEDWAVKHVAPSCYRAGIWRLTSGNAAASLRVYDSMEASAAKRELFELREGVGEVLEALKQRGLKLGLAANQPVGVLQMLDAHGIGKYFENPGVSGVYGYR